MPALTRLSLLIISLNLLTLESYAALPDLIPVRRVTARSIEIVTREITADDCALGEGCIKAPGIRKLLLFDTSIANIGRGHLTIGDPSVLTNLFEFDPCHGHYHMKYFATFRLFNSSGTVLRRYTRKTGFCLRDDTKYWADAPPSRGYVCDYQGITRGWQDNYPKTLPCQYLDITGLPRGQYLFQTTVNSKRALRESDYSNNSMTIPVTIR